MWAFDLCKILWPSVTLSSQNVYTITGNQEVVGVLHSCLVNCTNLLVVKMLRFSSPDFRLSLDFAVVICSFTHSHMLQWLLVWMLNWTNRQLLTWVRLKTESFHSGERFLPMSNTRCLKDSMRSYVLLAFGQDCLWLNVPTALLCCSFVWHCPRSWICVINGTMDNSE